MKLGFITAVALFVMSIGTVNAQPYTLSLESALSHSGGTDQCGCHRNSKTGEYHCHTRKKRGGSCPP
jgi:hypothetical protein